MKTTSTYQTISICYAAASLALALFLAGCASGGSAPNPPDPASALSVSDLGQVSVGTTGSALPAGWQSGAFMEIYVRGYKDSDGDGMGDLKGLISKLDYLQDLGVHGIWLMPVTDSADKDHGYAVRNYRAIETDYGSMADFDLLLAEAHQRGIGIIIDYVINHSSDRHPLFRNAASSASHAQRDYYLWQATAPSGWVIFNKNPWYASAAGNGYYFAGFGSGMPDFNLKNASAISFHQDNLRFWLNRGVDGMRFDAVGNLVENGPNAWENQPQNHVLMHGMRQLLDGYSQRYMVCEAPAAPQASGANSSCASAFAFDLKDAVIGAARADNASIQRLSQYFVTAPAGMAPFASNHDLFAGDRLWNQLGGDLARYKLAAASYLLLPGTPFIYYGEEIGMASAQGLGGDARLRTPMSWTADKNGFTSGTPFRALSANVATQNALTQAGASGSLHQFYKDMLRLRNSLPSIARGSYVAPFVAGQIMGYRRQLEQQTSLVLINYGSTAGEAALGNLGANTTLVARYGNTGNISADGTGQARVTLAAQSVSVFLLQP